MEPPEKNSEPEKNTEQERQRTTRTISLTKLSVLLAVLVTITTLIGVFTGTLDKLYHFFAKDITIAVRNEELVKGEDTDLMKLKFSLINTCKSDVFINSLKLRVRASGIGGGSNFLAWIFVKTFDRNFEVTLVRDATSRSLMPIIDEDTSKISMILKEFSILGKARIALEPQEQVDYNLEIKVKRPKDLAGKYDCIWDIGGQLVVEYERSDLEGGELKYPRR